MRFDDQDLFNVLIEKVLHDTQDRIAMFPSVNLFKVIYKQLKFIQEIVFEESRFPTYEEKNMVSLGWYSVNNFEKGNEYGDSLGKINYWFDNLRPV